jgi:hypothetical protein
MMFIMRPDRFAVVNLGTAWNPADKGAGITLTSSNKIATWGAAENGVRGIIGKNSGKWYYEILVNSKGASPNNGNTGLATAATTRDVIPNSTTAGGNYIFYRHDGGTFQEGASLGFVSAFVAGDRIGFSLDFTASQMRIYKNGSILKTRATLPAATYYPFAQNLSNGAQMAIQDAPLHLPAGFTNWF